jgi:hypothetical protein
MKESNKKRPCAKKDGIEMRISKFNRNKNYATRQPRECKDIPLHDVLNIKPQREQNAK